MKYIKLLDFSTYAVINQFTSGWGNLSFNNLNEGMRMSNGKIIVDFEEDLKNDTVRLNDVTKLDIVRKERVPVFRGYKLERESTDLAEFMKSVKKWGAFDDDTLKSIIGFTYPAELKNKSVGVIFITGSSDPLSAKIANALVEMYYPEAKVVDVLKKYYGADVKDIIDWDKYETSDDRTKEMIDTYLRQFSRRGDMRNTPRTEFEGYIKKSLGAQAGMRKALKPGHEIDDFIISNIVDAEAAWIENYRNNPAITDAEKVRRYPTYLFVDDTIIEGSTIRGIFKELKETLSSPLIKRKITSLALNNILGYCLFSYKS